MRTIVAVDGQADSEQRAANALTKYGHLSTDGHIPGGSIGVPSWCCCSPHARPNGPWFASSTMAAGPSGGPFRSSAHDGPDPTEFGV